MSAKTTIWFLFLGVLSIVTVLTINWFLDALLAFFVPGASMTPEVGGTFDIIIAVVFLIIDIVTIIAIFKWLRR